MRFPEFKSGFCAIGWLHNIYGVHSKNRRVALAYYRTQHCKRKSKNKLKTVHHKKNETVQWVGERQSWYVCK